MSFLHVVPLKLLALRAKLSTDSRVQATGRCDRTVFGDPMSHHMKITVEETEAAPKKMKPGKVTGLDDVAADLWKSKSWYPTKWLAPFFKHVIAEKKVSDIWQRCTTIPIWKKKGSSADCTNYRPIQ
ncbi:unnamed protein product [Heligmosomoides polygyrus]|uniref:Secreted protein n=1 Tax=Heligmosomoides polygyrus TaxID=6339 RepID=A0A183GF04_HELPZ|nr:unnamed protein product [Heligmosomoides polygyrus]